MKERGGFLDIAKIREKYEASLSDPEAQSAFRRYYLNLWDQKEHRAIDMVKWEASNGPWTAAGLLPKRPEHKVRPLPNDLMARFAQRQCWAGVDLSLTTDLSAVSFIFPRDDGGYDVLPFFWIPEQDIRKRELRDGMPYRQWAKQGYLEICSLIPGVVDYNEVQARIEWGAEVFDLQEICFDPWNSRQISASLVVKGHVCVEIRQGFASLSEPSKKLRELVTAGRLHHGGHPVLRWNASCVTAKENNDNLMSLNQSGPRVPRGSMESRRQ